MPIGYRPDIDGLRAIAVGAVVLYHAGIPGLPGGFTGVDIFFVISGYLIGGQIFRETMASGFSFAGFYTRRVRRILPALFFLLAAMFLAGAVLLSPQELRELGKEAVPTTFGLSNLLYYTGGGYFGPASDAQPLLMTWSLGVEEQFYIVLPFIMMLLVKLRRDAILPLLVAGALLSFAASLLLLHADPKAAFYLLPPRAWELGIGVSLAVWEERRGGAPLPRALAQGAALAGLLLLGTGIAAFRADIAFPGWFALLPTVGTAILIATPGSAINRRVLSLAPMRGIGLLSYSWYLWHWPLFYFNRTLAGREQEGGGLLPIWAILSLSLVCAFLSWRFVERPLRRRLLPDRAVLIRYGLAALAVAGVGAMLFASHGLPARLPAQARLFAAQAMAARENPCLARYGVTAPVSPERCLPDLPAGRARLVVLGDSHAASLSPAFAALARREHMGFGEMTKSSCLPVEDAGTAQADRPAHAGECRAYQRAAFAHVLRDPAARMVVLSGFWSATPRLEGPDGSVVPVEVALDRAVAALRRAGKRVIVVQDAPRFAFDPYARVMGDFLPMRRWLHGGAAAEPAGDAAPAGDPARSAIAAIARRYPGVTLIDPQAGLCTGGRCAFRDERAIYYFDDQHLTAPGALRALRRLSLSRDQDSV
ncbi:acyltransferase family protein [Sphingobium amiense]|nr:acyltransferase family protein [Sphingobium amiense]